jgi:hypothetical protein
LWPYVFDGHDDDVWDKLGEAVRNLHALDKLYISTYTLDFYYGAYYDSDGDEYPRNSSLTGRY